MNFKELEKTWQRQIVTGRDESAEMVVARMKHEVAGARRRIRGGIVLAAFVLLTGWMVSIVGHITSIKPYTIVALIGDAVNLIFFVAFFIRAFHSARTARNEMETVGGTLLESLPATLRTVELQMANARIARYAIPVVVAVNAWLLAAKYFAGEIPYFGAVIGSALMAVFGAIIGAAIWHRHRTHLAPRREELREMLQALEGEN